VATEVPGAQEVQLAQLVWLAAVVKVPGTQAAQVRLTVAVPAVITEVPAAQVVQRVQLGWLAAVEKSPAAQSAHVRSAVALPAVATNLPAMQGVCATQAVAGSESWSQVPAAHATEAAGPPAQKLPGEHGAQVGGVVAVPGAVCTLPAAQAVSGRHIVWLGPEENVPAAQAEHFWSVVALPIVEMKVPAAQVVHGVQRVEPAAL
jgi:hypothetical protein